MNRLSEAIKAIKEVRDKISLGKRTTKEDAHKLSLAIYKISTHHRDEEAKDV